MKWLQIYFLGLIWSVSSNQIEKECTASNKYCQPEQIHLSFGEKVNVIVVTWSTMLDARESVVQYGTKTTDHTVTGDRTLFVDGGPLKHYQWIHRVTLKDLKHDTIYVYKAGSKFGMSKEFSFKTPPAGENFIVKALFFGDMGIPHGKWHKTVKGLEQEIEGNQYHMVVHNGDLAYDMHSNNGHHGDAFMNMVQPIAANIPYMTSPGNHEAAYNFSNYKNRFSMPGGTQNMFYSFNLGPIHFVAINPEVYYQNGPSKAQVQSHYNWLVEDLKEANKKENRDKWPWIIMYGHRPMYCSSTTGWDRCRDGHTDHNYPHRVGIKEFGGMGLEVLLKDYGVDLVIWAHEHYYERAWPVYDKKVYNGTQGAYINPGAPVHITSGAGGNGEGQDRFDKNPLAWSAFGSSDYGYTRLHVNNRTHLHVEQMSTDAVKMLRGRWEPTKIDEMWLVRDEHKPFNI